MKKIRNVVMAVVLLPMLNSCFGEFAVTKAVFEFHKGIGGDDKMGTVIRSIPIWIPFGTAIYGIAGFADIVIFNLVEFWTGSNPLSMSAIEIEEQYAEVDGQEIKYVAYKNHLDVYDATSNALVCTYAYNEINQNWDVISNEQVVATLSNEEFENGGMN